MKVDYLSDLHLNHWVLFSENQVKLSKKVYNFLDEIFSSKDPESEVLVLGGDYSEYNIYTKWMINYVSKLYDKVFLVFGNHDFYLGNKTQAKKFKKSSNRISEIIIYADKFNNVEILNNSFAFHKDKLFVGIMNYPEVDSNLLSIMKEVSNDYKYITHDSFPYMNVDNTNFDLLDTDLLISHVPPLKENPLAYEKENPLYYNDLKLKKNVKNVVFGHDHAVGMFECGGVKYHTNALGYPEKYTFEPLKDYDLTDVIRTIVI